MKPIYEQRLEALQPDMEDLMADAQEEILHWKEAVGRIRTCVGHRRDYRDAEVLDGVEAILRQYDVQEEQWCPHCGAGLEPGPWHTPGCPRREELE